MRHFLRNLLRFILRHGPLIPLVAMLIMAIALATYIAGTTAIRPPTTTLPIASLSTELTPWQAPAVLYARIDPAIAEALYRWPVSADNSFGYVPGIPAIGAYLPRTGDVAFTLAGPTPTPTLLPFPTPLPLPLPPVPGDLPTLVPTLVPTPFPTFASLVALPTSLPVSQLANCAPAGRPVDGILTQRFHVYHIGIDIGIPLGTPVIATHSGIITFAGWSDVGYGYLVILQNGDFITYYAHNTSFNIVEGQFVQRGNIIAFSGSTGNSTGPHVHYETRIRDVPVDPLTFESRGYATC